MVINLSSDTKQQSGIYQIRNTKNGKVYIGQTTNFINRARQHKSSLSRGVHKNHHLQNSVTKYGINNFVFEMVELCSKDMLDETETKWLQIYSLNPTLCYNHDFVVKKQQRATAALSEAIKRSWAQNIHRKELLKQKMPALLAASNEKKRKTYKFHDPTGTMRITNNLPQFAKDNDLSYEMLRKLHKGIYYEHKGWTSVECTKETHLRLSKMKEYVFWSETMGEIHTRNIAHFAKEMSLDKRSVFKLIKGTLTHVKEWKFIHTIALSTGRDINIPC